MLFKRFPCIIGDDAEGDLVLSACQPVGRFAPSMLSSSIIKKSCNGTFIISNFFRPLYTHHTGLLGTK